MSFPDRAAMACCSPRTAFHTPGVWEVAFRTGGGASVDLVELLRRDLVRGLTAKLREPPPRIAAASPSERAASGTLHGNCSSCHNATGPLASLSLDLAYPLAHADCHTPLKLGPKGPEPDLARNFSGHPAEMVLSPAPALPPGPRIATIAATMTAWSGPWGTSFTSNLTPDRETGLGQWTADEFVATLKTGRHMGRGREILPPMPIQATRNLSDEDLRAMFAYLQSLPPVKNRVPDPLPPADAR